MEPGPDQAVIRPAVSPVRVIRLGDPLVRLEKEQNQNV